MMPVCHNKGTDAYIKLECTDREQLISLLSKAQEARNLTLPATAPIDPRPTPSRPQ